MLVGFWWCMAIYGFGTVVGLAGLGTLIFESRQNKAVKLTCKVFGGVAILGIVFAWGVAFGRSKHHNDREKLAIVLTVTILGILAALFSDWVLAGLAGNAIDSVGWRSAPVKSRQLGFSTHALRSCASEVRALARASTSGHEKTGAIYILGGSQHNANSGVSSRADPTNAGPNCWRYDIQVKGGWIVDIGNKLVNGGIEGVNNLLDDE
ncbi:hypothetical protein K440DRAFT_641987 [Wilcoxina mikolae CBS 423.85]|nr:hypothetical protein K440DRAFT_641987 [Wilcoxina mikolae CBS 423.85]